MKRKYVYSALGLPIVVAALSLAMLPAQTRSMFLTEFKHRFLGMFFEEQQQPLEGLRRQNPEEYGPQPGAPEGEVDNGGETESGGTGSDETGSGQSEPDETESDETESDETESIGGLDSDVDENENP